MQYSKEVINVWRVKKRISELLVQSTNGVSVLEGKERKGKERKRTAME